MHIKSSDNVMKNKEQNESQAKMDMQHNLIACNFLTFNCDSSQMRFFLHASLTYGLIGTVKKFATVVTTKWLNDLYFLQYDYNYSPTQYIPPTKLV